jgi:hypothetical protein
MTDKKNTNKPEMRGCDFYIGACIFALVVMGTLFILSNS